MAAEVMEKQLWDAASLEERWGISKYSVNRLMKAGELKSVTIGARRLVPLAEVERAEQYGVGKPRKRGKATNADYTAR